MHNTYREYDIYSKKYHVSGNIKVYPVVKFISFQYNGKNIEFAVNPPLFDSDKIKKYGEKVIDNYIENLSSQELKKTMLHYWYIENSKGAPRAHGIVTNHYRLPDSIKIHTSEILNTKIVDNEILFETRNTTYYCPLEYCRWDKQDEYPSLLEGYSDIKEQYQGKIKNPEIEAGKVLLVISDFDSYYFHSLYYKPDENSEPIKYESHAHVGTFQDSFLIYNTKERKIDIRYFPHMQNIEFYSTYTDGAPLFIENIGKSTLFVNKRIGAMRLEPGERKEYCEENITDDITNLPNGDLYPIRII